jgi:hypothetical protein
VIILSGCSTAWTQEASNIISLLLPSITSILGILSAFGVGISPSVMTAITQWSTDAQSGLQTVATLITQYESALPADQPGILTEIQTALSTITKNLATILPEIKVTNAETQAKILAVINAVQSELVALTNLVPALQGKVTAHDDLKAMVAELKTAKEYKNDFNGKVKALGPDASRFTLK